MIKYIFSNNTIHDKYIYYNNLLKTKKITINDMIKNISTFLLHNYIIDY